MMLESVLFNGTEIELEKDKDSVEGYYYKFEYTHNGKPAKRIGWEESRKKAIDKALKSLTQLTS